MNELEVVLSESQYIGLQNIIMSYMKNSKSFAKEVLSKCTYINIEPDDSYDYERIDCFDEYYGDYVDIILDWLKENGYSARTDDTYEKVFDGLSKTMTLFDFYLDDEDNIIDKNGCLLVNMSNNTIKKESIGCFYRGVIDGWYSKIAVPNEDYSNMGFTLKIDRVILQSYEAAKRLSNLHISQVGFENDFVDVSAKIDVLRDYLSKDTQSSETYFNLGDLDFTDIMYDLEDYNKISDTNSLAIIYTGKYIAFNSYGTEYYVENTKWLRDTKLKYLNYIEHIMGTVEPCKIFILNGVNLKGKLKIECTKKVKGDSVKIVVLC